jgi:pimeloyl-ACP methyl ester carboxylesterase
VQHRRRVDKLLLVDAAGLPNPLPFTGKFFALPRVGELLLGINSLAIRKKNLKDVFIWNNDFVTDSYAENVTRWHKIAGSTKASMAVLRGDFFGTLGDEIQQLGQMDVPTLIVWGRHDAGIPLARGEQMHQIVKGSRLEIIENAGHVPNQEQPQIFNQIALDFL